MFLTALCFYYPYFICGYLRLFIQEWNIHKKIIGIILLTVLIGFNKLAIV